MLDWLQNHGEVFLRKNVGVGRNLQKARAYQKSHQTFEGVVQVKISFSFSIVMVEHNENNRRILDVHLNTFLDYRIHIPMPKNFLPLPQNLPRLVNAMLMISTGK